MLSSVILFPLVLVVVASARFKQVPGYVRAELDREMCRRKFVQETVDVEESVCENEIKHHEWKLNTTNNFQDPEVICREDEFVAIKMSIPNATHFVEMQYDNNPWTLHGTYNSEVFRVNGLLPETMYRFRTWSLTKTGKLFNSTASTIVSTIPAKYTPQEIENLTLHNLVLKDNTYIAEVNWKPSTDMVCFYELVWFGGEDVADYTQKEIKDPNQLFTTQIKNLQFGSTYSVAVMAKSSNWNTESSKIWIQFSTPSCLEALNSLEHCVPEVPTGLQSNETACNEIELDNLYNVSVSWDLPKLIPDYYTIHFLSIQDENGTGGFAMNISGDSVFAVFDYVDIGIQYQLSLIAWSNGGRSDTATIVKTVTSINTVKTRFISFKLLLLVVVVPITLLLAFIVVMAHGYRRLKKEQTMRRSRYFQEADLKETQLSMMDKNLQIGFSDEWEIVPEKLLLKSVLGQGAFGLVRRGWLERDGKKIEVAVKMLQDSSTTQDRIEFLKEIDIMKSVGSHQNIISMIGCCTMLRDRSPLLIVEYCSRGDLLSFLRTTWDNLSTEVEEVRYADLDLMPDEYPKSHNFTNKLYLLNVDHGPVYPRIQIKDLLSIAHQVAMGMEYLSNLQIVHRDLAARNVLIAGDGTIKVSDFGLSRDVYRDNVYRKHGPGKVPVKWLALESLTHQKYTVHSDVWSYGILTWEIVTLGGNPYPGIDTQDLMALLKTGYRMAMPSNCSKELYSLMCDCWKANPKDRPNFTDIRKKLDAFLEAASDYLTLDAKAYNKTSIFSNICHIQKKNTYK